MILRLDVFFMPYSQNNIYVVCFSESNRNELVMKGALPVLVDVLRSCDPDVQYYCAAALSNMAVNERHRAMMVAVGFNDVIRELKVLLSANREKVIKISDLAISDRKRPSFKGFMIILIFNALARV